MLLAAPALVMPTFAQASDLLRPDGLPGLNAFASMWCCIENILVAAAAEGIFGVTRIPFPEERARIRRVLRIPEGKEVPCYLALGYPAAGAKVHRVPERPIGSRLHLNSW
jgi:nitroreductase